MMLSDALHIMAMMEEGRVDLDDEERRRYLNGNVETTHGRDWGHENDFHLDDGMDSDEMPF